MVQESNPVKELLSGSYYYESTSVGSTRKSKSCDLCSSSIPKGSSHKGAKLFNSDFYQVDFCSECEEKYKKELEEMKSGKYDSY
jgi:hypothetical protein